MRAPIKPFHGWTGTFTCLEMAQKQYTIYVLEHSQTGEHRVLYNWGSLGTNGQWKYDPSGFNGRDKFDQKRRKGYKVIELDEPFEVTNKHLNLVGVTIDPTAQPQPDQPQSRLNRDDPSTWAQEIASVLSNSGLSTDVLIAYNQLKQELHARRRQLAEAEGSFEMLTHMIEGHTP